MKISMGGSRFATVWTPTEMPWPDFCKRLETPVRGVETAAEYRKLSKADQDARKDVGGFVGGVFDGNRRLAVNLRERSLITLDMDSMTAPDADRVLRAVAQTRAVVYSTRKHTPEHPRLRVILLPDRVMAPDEYEPAARMAAQLIGIDYCDPTTFDGARLMYWPSVSSDGQYVYRVFDGAPVSVDGLLARYEDWHDVASWPRVAGESEKVSKSAARQEDPTEKRGLVGAFCRTYDVEAAMDAYLPGVYTPAGPGRYTYTGGSTTGGAVVYEGGKFLYSHHATDPVSGRLVNAFDLVRLHLYSDLDRDAKPGTPAGRLPSYQALQKRVISSDEAVTGLMNKERLKEAQKVFECDAEADWMSKLERDQNGGVKSTINNGVLILENDPNLKGKIAIDEFASCGMILGPLPWDSREDKRRWRDVDDANLYNYMEVAFGLSAREKIDNALTIVSGKHVINDVRRYLEGLQWDGTPRLATLLSDYLGAEKNDYTAAVMTKSLAAAVARAIDGAVKYDYMPIFTGPQGIGKSTFLATLGGEWFSDSLTTFEGKEAAELIQGTWINEIGELTAMSRQETSSVKQFLSKKDDIYRAAYGRRSERYPRRCVFYGTSNDAEFLRDVTGNRRFWPVDVGIHEPVKSVWDDLPEERDQIWAEAVVRYRLGEKLYLPSDIEKMALAEQDSHREMSAKEGLVRDYLERMVPEDWYDRSIQDHLAYLNGVSLLPDDTKLVKRDRVCVMEIWVECLGGKKGYIRKSDSAEINGIMKQIEGWGRLSTGRFGPYGRQRGYIRMDK